MKKQTILMCYFAIVGCIFSTPFAQVAHAEEKEVAVAVAQPVVATMSESNLPTVGNTLNGSVMTSIAPIVEQVEAERKAELAKQEAAKIAAEKAEAAKKAAAEQAAKAKERKAQTTASQNSGSSTNRLTKSKGVVYFNGHRETYYSQKVLPGGGLKIPGRHVASDGTIRDGNNYICVASNDYAKGTIVETSLGTAKVYDSGCASGTIDIYVNW